MEKTTKYIIGGGILAAVIFGVIKFAQMTNFAKLLTFSPKLNGNLKSIKTTVFDVTIPLAVDLGNRTDQTMTVGGKVEKGILLRHDVSDRLVESNTKIEAKVSVPIEKAKYHILNMAKSTDLHCSGKIVILKNYYGNFAIHTQGSSKQEFEWIITNPRLIELSDSDYGFQKMYKDWQARFNAADNR